MLRRSNLLLSFILMLSASVITFSQNDNSSSAAASVRTGLTSVTVIGIGAVMLVAGAFIGYIIGRNRKS